MALDPHSQAAVEALVGNDPEFANLVKKVAAEALKVQLRFLVHGTPQEKLSISRAFLPVFVKTLTGQKADQDTENMLDSVRGLISGIIPKEEA